MNHLALELGKVSDQELHSRMLAISKTEQQTTLEVLVHLHEVFVRHLYAKKSYASLWDYTVRALGYGESQASERIKAMQLMFRASEVKEALETGKLNLTQAAMAERHLRTEEKEKNTRVSAREVRELIVELAGKTKRETEKALFSLRPLETTPVKETIRPVSEEISEVRFPVTEETRQAIERYWELNGRCPLSEMFTTCLTFLLKTKDPMQKHQMEGDVTTKGENLQRPLTTTAKDQPAPVKTEKQDLPYPAEAHEQDQKNELPLLLDKVDEGQIDSHRSRYISMKSRREVLKRSQGCCEHIDPETSLRCQSRYLIQFDHIYPYALGGTSESSNIRALCSMHNRYLAKKIYSQAWEAIAPYGEQSFSIRSDMGLDPGN